MTNPTSAGYLAVFPGGSPPNVSNLNFVAGKTVPNRVVVPLGAGGQVSLYNSAGTVDVIADVGGWFTDPSGTGHGSRFAPLSPQRLLDTRNGFGSVPPGGRAVMQVADRSAIGLSALVLNVTVTNPTAPSYLALWPDGSARPTTSDLNYVANQTVPNLVTVKLDSNGGFDLYNLAGSTDVVIDLAGYYGPAS